MANLVSMQEAYWHLRLGEYDSSGGPEDAWLNVFIPAVSEAVLNWLKESWRAYVPAEDSNGDPLTDSAGDQIPAEPLVARPSVKAAVLVELASQFRYREGEGVDNVVPSEAGHGYVLNKASTALLAPLRKGTIA